MKMHTKAQGILEGRIQQLNKTISEVQDEISCAYAKYDERRRFRALLEVERDALVESRQVLLDHDADAVANRLVDNAKDAAADTPPDVEAADVRTKAGMPTGEQA